VHDRLKARLGLLLGDAGFEAAEGVDPAVAARQEHVFRITDVYLRHHHDGNEDFRGEAEFDAVKTLLGDTYYGHLVIVDVQCFANDLGIAGETCFPKIVIENDIGMAAGNDVVLGRENAAHGGDNAESGEVSTGNEFYRNALGLLAEGKTGGVGEAAEHIGEDFVVRAEITEHGMGDSVAAPVAAIVAALHGEKYELLGILDGEEAQQDLIEKGKDRGVCADAEGQREDGYGCEAGSAGEHAEGVLEVAKDSVEPAADGETAVGIISGFSHRDTSR